MPNDNNVINLKSQGPDKFISFLKKLSLFPVLILIAILVIPTTFFTVAPDEDAVILRFGKYNRTLGPGPHFKLPLNLEEYKKIPVRKVMKMEFGFRTNVPGVRTSYSREGYDAESIMLTGDLNVVDVTWIIQYQIKDAKDFLFNVHNVPKNLFDISEAVMRQIIGDYTFSEAITEEREHIAQLAMTTMQTILDEYKMGIRLVALELQDVYPPDEVRPSFDQVNAAVQDAEQIANIAKKVREKEIEEEKGLSKQVENQAQAYKIDLINHAKGDVERFMALYQEYTKAPKITKQRLYFDQMKDTLSKADKVYIIDPEVKGIMPYLNIQGAK